MALFVSYCSVDQKPVKGLLGQLARLKREVYTETKSVSGEVAWSVIFETIQACDAFILALTPHVLLSESRRLEYQYAVALHKPILVVALEAIADNVTEDGKVAYIDVSKALDFREPDEASTALADALANLPPSEALPSPLPTPPDWTSPLNDLKQAVQQPRIPFKEQPALVLNLREYLERKESNKTALALLRILNKHTARSVDSAQDIADTLDQVDQVDRKSQPSITGTRIALALIVLFALLTLGIILLRGFPALNSQTNTAVTSTPSRTAVATGSPAASATPTATPTSQASLQTSLTQPAETVTFIAQQTQAAVSSQLAVMATQADATLRAVTSLTSQPSATEAVTATRPTSTPTSSPTTADTSTLVPAAVLPSATTSATQTALPSNTALPTATKTFTSSPTNTASATRTPLPTNTATSTVTTTPTSSPTRTATATNTASATPTRTFTASPTNTASATRTPLPTNTVTPISSPTTTASTTRAPLPTNTPRPTITRTLTLQSTNLVSLASSQTITPTQATETALPTMTTEYTGMRVEDSPQGVRVIEVGSTATLAGIRVGDYILSIDLEPVNSRDDFMRLMNKSRPFSTVRMHIKRSDGLATVQLQLGVLDFVVPTPVATEEAAASSGSISTLRP